MNEIKVKGNSEEKFKKTERAMREKDYDGKK